MQSGRMALLVIFTLGELAASEPKPQKAEPELPPLNSKVLKYCREHFGEKVTNGQCASLAVEALRDAGGKLFPRGDRDGDYVWGRQVDSFRDALPGDVVQFRDVVFKGRRSLSGNRILTWRESFSHHTAVVSEVKERGKIVTILHQNTGPDGSTEEEMMVVKEGKLRLDALQPGGKIWIYRPIPVSDR